MVVSYVLTIHMYLVSTNLAVSHQVPYVFTYLRSNHLYILYLLTYDTYLLTFK